MTERHTSFTAFVEEHEPRLRAAMIARYGPDQGREATSEALAYSWEHWDRIRSMTNPAGYLYRVAQHAGLPRKRHPVFPEPPHHSEPLVEPGLPAALASLSERQRVTVMLVHSFGWSQTETARFLGISESALRNHLRRGMAKLRSALEVTVDA
jgi:DNA-directed RNA polymerase specialized sigma24 family protein